MNTIVMFCPHIPVPALANFLRDELELEEADYFSFQQDGGTIAFPRAGIMPEDFNLLFNKFTNSLAEHPEVNDIVLINHAGCHRYDQLIDREEERDPEKKDLISAAGTMRWVWHRTRVRAYYAENQPTGISFEKVFEECPVPARELQAV